MIKAVLFITLFSGVIANGAHECKAPRSSHRRLDFGMHDILTPIVRKTSPSPSPEAVMKNEIQKLKAELTRRHVDFMEIDGVDTETELAYYMDHMYKVFEQELPEVSQYIVVRS